MKRLMIFLAFSASLYAKVGCENPLYSGICQKVVKDGVSLTYANDFFTSSKVKIFDELSFKLMQPSQIANHKKVEKKANNELLSFVPKMVEHLKDYEQTYAVAEAKFGVNKEIIAAILAKETRLGAIVPKHDAFVVFHTLLSKTKPNSDREKWLINMSKSNMINIIKHCYKNSITPDNCNLNSSYAGAIGISQFMPNNLKLAISSSNEAPDITKMEDAILSAANFLNQRANFNELIDWQRSGDVQMVENEWYEYEFTHKNASLIYSTNAKGQKVYSCFLCTKKEFDYLGALAKKIMSYNNSSNYAIGVLRLAYEANRALNAIK